MFLNLSYPKPIITAENVPPKTTTIGGIKNKASNAPPSQKNAPNMESIPSNNPLNVLAFLVISNLKLTGAIPMRPSYMPFAAEHPDSVNLQQPLLHQHFEYRIPGPAIAVFGCSINFLNL